MRFVPNTITALRVVLAPLLILCLLQDTRWTQITALVLFVLAAGSDWADGHVARMMNAQSRIGRFLDPFADKVLVLGTFSALSWLYPEQVPWWAVLLIFARDILVTVLRMVAEVSGKSLRTIRFAKAKTVLQLAFLTVVIILRVLSYVPDTARFAEQALFSGYIFWMLMFVVGMTLLTGFRYLIRTDYVNPV